MYANFMHKIKLSGSNKKIMSVEPDRTSCFVARAHTPHTIRSQCAFLHSNIRTQIDCIYYKYVSIGSMQR